ncbi:hypothetical protein AMAG_05959 [Allomyces macrogynus ATCC 38327]|uniref:Late embryogenesis abundant protein LEA-2 subgroup domain-containing protein n=1 Tax=Allomyces macrogynus (strain ATCC 38327) TaxID=578462 RepID=A0A0L0SDF2_ALLM3|nr:hypothetical protein AMAG_05959 [Allomyces macrogynus ATCC 38327]|eukprot:KNE60578.1 hypothetical protein AMAG_05959 [Allomyces macrogynus ATCC 38327]
MRSNSVGHSYNSSPAPAAMATPPAPTPTPFLSTSSPHFGAPAAPSLPRHRDRCAAGSRACGCCCCGGSFMCCCCGVLIFLIVAIGAAAAFLFWYIKIPTVQFVKAQAPTDRSPLVLNTATATVNINWDFVFSVNNPNALGIGIASLDMAGYPSSAQSKDADRIANGTATDIHIESKATTPINFPVTFTWNLQQQSQSAFLSGMLTACGAQSGSPGGGQLSVYYELKVGLAMLKPFGYKYPYKDTQAFACPVNLSQFAEIQKVLQLINNATSAATSKSG